MGMAVLAQGFEDHTDMCPMLDDDDVEQYDPLDAKTFGAGEDDCAKITWSPNGCGWLLQAPPMPAPKPPPVSSSCPYSTCLDKVPEANWIFGFEADEYDEKICDRTEPWLAAPGYCQNALWKALCPESCPSVTCDMCGVWMSDNVEAADVLTSMLTLPAGGCASLKDANMCEDP